MQSLAAGAEQVSGILQLVPDEVGSHPLRRTGQGADGQQGERESALFWCSRQGYPLTDKFIDRISREKIIPLFSAVLGNNLEFCI